MSITDNIPDEEGTDVAAAEAAHDVAVQASIAAAEARAAADNQALATGGIVVIGADGSAKVKAVKPDKVDPSLPVNQPAPEPDDAVSPGLGYDERSL
jgi:hypothetical protein